MVQRKYGGFIIFLLLMNFIGLMFKIDLTATYLLLAFVMFAISAFMFIYLNIKISTMSKQDHPNSEALATLNTVLEASPATMLSSVLPYVVVTAVNLFLKATWR